LSLNGGVENAVLQIVVLGSSVIVLFKMMVSAGATVYAALTTMAIASVGESTYFLFTRTHIDE